MVTVIDFKERENVNGETFVVLILQGQVELVQSKQTGQFYATARKTSITSTFDANTAKTMVGQQLPGCIEKQECPPYEHTNKETGEVTELNYIYGYNPNGTESPVIRTNPIKKAKVQEEEKFELPFAEKTKPQFSMNGVH